jgi:NACHT domain
LEDKKCLKDLRLSNPKDDMKRIEDTKGGLLKDSYRWILNHQAFINWRDGDKTRVLWINGEPGKGKTMLLIGVVRELEKLKSTHQSGLLSYFFCQATDPNLNKATAVLGGLIYQLIDQQQSLISHLRERYDKEKHLFKGVNAFYALQDIFTKILDDPHLIRVYLIVDALDECESGLEQLLDLIVRDPSTSSCRVKWLVSSRNRRDIKEQLGTNESTVQCSLELNAESLSQAVGVYIDHKVSELEQRKRYDPNLRDRVRNELHQKANHTFLWVALVCKELRKVNNWNALKWLQKVPSDLTSLYDRMIKQIQQSEDKSLCLQVLSISTLACRPFHLLELVALADLPEEVSCSQENVREIIYMCGSFLTIREDTIYFIHQSAKDYLSGNPVEHLIFPSGRTAVHRRIVSQSLQHMDEKLDRDIYNLRDAGISIDQVMSPHPDPLSQIRYACVYWIDHLCKMDSSSHDQYGLCDNGRIATFLEKHFLHWLEALSLLRRVSEGILSMDKLEGLLQVSLKS